MDNEKWSSFIGGVVVGVLIALGIGGTFGWQQLQHARALEAELRAASEMARQEAERAMQAEREARKKAEEALQQFGKGRPGDKGQK